MNKIKVRSQQFIDEHDRERIFYGINLGCKNVPYMKVYEDTDSIDTLHANIHYLHTHGINAIRFILNWSYLQPEPYKYNEEALNGIQEFMDICADNDIYVYLDMHQDLYSAFTDIEKADLTKLHGNGAPEWACVTDGKKFKMPKKVWAEGYFISKAVHNAFNHFWNNTVVYGMGLQDHFANLWKMLAKRFGNHPALLGFDIFNEPFPYRYDKNIFFIIVKSVIKTTLKRRDINKFKLISALFKEEPIPALLNQYNSKIMQEITSPANKYIEKFDKEKYSPFLNKVAAAIREETNNGIIFMENCYYSNLGIPFSAPPITVKQQHEPNQAFAPHAYDLMVDTPLYKYANNDRVGAIFHRRKDEQSHLDVPVLVGEWGGGNLIHDWLSHAEYLLNIFDSFKWSHTYWCFDPIMIDSLIMDTLCRPHPIAVCGSINNYHFDKSSQVFILSFNQEKTYSAATEIFCHKYPKSVDTSGTYNIAMLNENCCILSLVTDVGENIITIKF